MRAAAPVIPRESLTSDQMLCIGWEAGRGTRQCERVSAEKKRKRRHAWQQRSPPQLATPRKLSARSKTLVVVSHCSAWGTGGEERGRQASGGEAKGHGERAEKKAGGGLEERGGHRESEREAEATMEMMSSA